ncbi:MAG: hypothetical protein A2381_09800 [Bdellovibrionales bacterium RIFOXYB1_FULL_37_110]|nr:MAG: hypothetical protein A2181_02880 [Bdellovibrionales bacterium RIFOXYA1_FULL_38_20]OFZ48885.1 MAG: hypothetical protein A2417_08260 [Bdellovibrionales bacterium RIFOXYC1_FULL_37_79]OFZ59562.1 MAG: hypothetical protein A2381_09800 [Bdellovibrionales bacterium RIFOXYB1_FULL_37_110]OFZ62459.1 MAG: hypothetical protein A2577_03455 [Bdellovibrionales bacterium RIFOXYD1_FULL_36_51]
MVDLYVQEARTFFLQDSFLELNIIKGFKKKAAKMGGKNSGTNFGRKKWFFLQKPEAFLNVCSLFLF